MKNFEDMLGRCILVGITYVDPSGKEVSLVQQYGKILSCDEEQIVFFDNVEKKRVSLPPDYENIFEVDSSNVYKLKNTQEEITGINFVSSFEVELSE